MQNLPVLFAISFVKVLASTTSTTVEVGWFLKHYFNLFYI